jgi:polyphosphate glucokinase
MGPRPRTLAVDCGGTGIKATVLDLAGTPLQPRAKVTTPYPCPPGTLVQTVVDLAATIDEGYERASVGFPGMVRHGVVRATPHFVTESGPFTEPRPDLVREWAGYDVRAALEAALGCPTRVLNDAEVAGLAVITAAGFEAMFTLGTGFGCGLFEDGRVLPKIEMSLAPFRDGETYDQQLGHHARDALGVDVWNERVSTAITTLRPVLWWDRLFIGGGAAKYITRDLGRDVTIVTNQSGLLGGVRLWDLPE